MTSQKRTKISKKTVFIYRNLKRLYSNGLSDPTSDPTTILPTTATVTGIMPGGV